MVVTSSLARLPSSSSSNKRSRLLFFSFLGGLSLGYVLWGFQGISGSCQLTLTPHGSGDVVSAAARSLEESPIGSLGPKGTEREHLIYYDSLFYLGLQFGRNAKSLLEVGCAKDPFAQYLSWIPDKKCVAPYRVNYDNKALDALPPNQRVDFVEADFMTYSVPHKYDLLICSQVVEHVPDPAGFLKKLIQAAKISIVSVPYKWPKCGNCNHRSNDISLEKIIEWAAPYKPQHHIIIRETDLGGENFHSRIIVVFQNP